MKTHTAPAPQKTGAPRAASIEELEADAALKEAEYDRCKAALTAKHRFLRETADLLAPLAWEARKLRLPELAKLTSATLVAFHDRSRAESAIIDFEKAMSEFVAAIQLLDEAKRSLGNGATA